MVIQIQTSFVPKKMPGIGPTGPGIVGRRLNLFTAFALVVFSVTAILAGIVFFYKAHLINTISAMDVELANARKSFEPEFIDEASRLNARIAGAQELLNTHRAVSPLFTILEKKTLESVRFQDFNLSIIDGKEATLSMTGQAKSFNAVALQSDVFGAEKAFRDPVFSNFNLNDDGDVIFNFKTTIDSAVIRYREAVLGGAGDTDGAQIGVDDDTTNFDGEVDSEPNL